MRIRGETDLSIHKAIFIKKALLKNPTFNYDKFVYRGQSRKGEIICDKGHSFLSTPQNHLSIESSGCKKCKQKIPVDKRETISVTCPIHGIFTIKHHLYLNGKGCQRCSLSQNTSGFSYQRRLKMSQERCQGLDNFYIIKLQSKFSLESFYKVGVTFNLKQRLKEISRNYNISVLFFIQSSCELIHSIEKQSIKLKKNKKYKPLIDFCGSKKECFSNIDGILDNIPFDQVKVITDLLSTQEQAA